MGEEEKEEGRVDGGGGDTQGLVFKLTQLEM